MCCSALTVAVPTAVVSTSELTKGKVRGSYSCTREPHPHPLSDRSWLLNSSSSCSPAVISPGTAVILTWQHQSPRRFSVGDCGLRSGLAPNLVDFTYCSSVSLAQFPMLRRISIAMTHFKSLQTIQIVSHSISNCYSTVKSLGRISIRDFNRSH